MFPVHLDGNYLLDHVALIVRMVITRQWMAVSGAIILVRTAQVIEHFFYMIVTERFCFCVGCKNQDDKRRINVEALLFSAQPVSTLQFVNPYNFVTGLAVIACLCIIILFVVVFIVLQVS